MLKVFTAILTPNESHACPSDTVTFYCVINEESSQNLRWIVDFMHPSIWTTERTFIAGVDVPVLTRRDVNNVGQSITFTLISTYPYINSTMTTTIPATPIFDRVSVSCNDGSATFAASDMASVYIITQAPALDPNITLTVKEYLERWIVLQINWTQHTIPTQYSVFWTSIHESSVTTTSNNSVRLILSYNSEYNVSLIASNCFGYSIPVSNIFKLDRCNAPVVDHNIIVEGYTNHYGIEGSQISYHCQRGLEPRESVISTCISGRMWDPNPTEHNCTAADYKPTICGAPTLQSDVIIELNQGFMAGSIIIYYCNGSSPYTNGTVSVCKEGGKWIPDPAEYSCKDIPGLKEIFNPYAGVIGVVISGVFILVLCVIMVLISSTAAVKFAYSRRRVTKSGDIVYDEISTGVYPHPVILKENSAYSGEVSTECKNMM